MATPTARTTRTNALTLRARLELPASTAWPLVLAFGFDVVVRGTA